MAHIRHGIGKFKDIHAAARKGAIAQVNEFLDLGIDANVRRDDGSTALMWAAFNAHPEVIALLISRGGDVRITDRDGLKAEHYATGYDPGPDSQPGWAERQRRANDTTKLLFLREIELQAESKLYRTRAKELWKRVSTSVAAKNFYKAQSVISAMQGILGTSSTNVSMLRKKSMRLKDDQDAKRIRAAAAAAGSAAAVNLDDIGEQVEEVDDDDDGADSSSDSSSS